MAVKHNQNNNKKKILVTGSDGYIGTEIVKELIRSDYEVVGLDTQYFKDIILGTKPLSYSLLNTDIRLIKKLGLSQFYAIIHLAALSNDPSGELNPSLTRKINYQATINLARLAKKSKCHRFIFSSSCSIYGKSMNQTVNEDSPINPLTAYAKSKILSEKALIKLADKKFCVAILRNSTVYGYSPKFRNDLVVNNLLTSAIAFGEIKVMSDGTPWRPLIDVRDLAKIFMKFLEIESNKINRQIFNIGFKENNFQIKDIVSKIYQHLPDCKIVYTGEHGNDSRSYKVDFSKFHHLLPSLKQQWPLEKSIKDLIIRLKEKHFKEEDFLKDNFTRLTVLKELISQKRLNNELFWINKQ